MERVGGEEQVDGCVVPPEADLLVVLGCADVGRAVPDTRRERSEHASGLRRRHEDVDVDVAGGPWLLGRVGQRQRTTERPGQAGAIEVVAHVDDPFDERGHRCAFASGRGR